MEELQKKQYVLSANPLDLPGMVLHKVAGVYLYADPQLNFLKTTSYTKKTVWVLGNAYCMDDAPKSVCDDIAAWDGKDLSRLTRFWTGRWVLICDDTLITDACGLMAAFHTVTQDGWLISSSLAMLAKLCGVEQEEVCEQTGLNWQLLPGSLVAGVNKLCSTQKLVLSPLQLSIQPYLWQQDCTGGATEEKSEEMCRLLTNACKNIAASGKRLYLALTAGKDSRLVFAALSYSGVPFETYTSDYPNISCGDRTLPAKMSEDAGIRHSYIKRKPYDTKKENRYRQFTFGDTNGLDAVFYAFGQFEQLPENAIVIRSGLFEAGQSYGRTVAGNTRESLEQGIRAYYASAFAKERQKTAFSQWLQWIEENPIPFIDIRDRFYIEQRVGGWAAAIEQSLDLNDFTSIQIANCPRLLSILLSASEEERKVAAISMQSIRMLKPALMQYPVNKRTVWDSVNYVFSVMRNPVRRFCNLMNRYRRK